LIGILIVILLHYVAKLFITKTRKRNSEKANVEVMNSACRELHYVAKLFITKTRKRNSEKAVRCSTCYQTNGFKILNYF